MPWSFFILAAIALYCAVQAFRDFRRRQYVWAAFGAAATVGLLLIPIPTHAVKVQLPTATPR